ncbi:hypothetical protein PTTG_03255 [Puccinia triticina 1-1 BBBD Race 1]|uniref:No apical meristem-associated C-terminal domain-containing protein n=1 Tax=Puccinia triticina (isolate 1-1 / race 1 (BBBD)) TaxID=630390 RepID=A0A180GHM1_PUCT1|nr:hypothetical protein PTTG_03255 [Puccinia triticina 1-1 BBBD Race 1]
MDPSPSLMTQQSLGQATRGASSAIPTSPAPSQAAPITRRAFPNQRLTEASPAGPHREPKVKASTSLASAFKKSNTKKFGYLREHMKWEKEMEDTRNTAKLELTDVKMKAAQEWLKEGKSAAELESLMRAIYG